MSEHIKTNDNVYFIANFYHPVSGFSYPADVTPRWLVWESGATLVSQGAMTAKPTITGSYWGTFTATTTTFTSGRFYDVQVSGTVGGITGFSKVKEFIFNDIFDANIVQISGLYVSPTNTMDANVVQVSGLPISPRSVYDANVVQVSGQYVGYESTVDANVVQVSGVPVSLADFNTGSGVSGADAATIWSYASRGLTTAVSVSGIPTVNVVQVSGVPVSLGDFNSGGAANVWSYATRSLTAAVSVSGIVDANIVQVSGQPISGSATIDANVVQVSGVYVSLADFNTGATSDIYFAHIKYVSDLTNNQDEFAVQWFKNDQPVSSGQLTNPRLSVYNTSTGAAVIGNQNMSYASPNLGVVRYNKTPMVLASGEPYLVETSGTIDSSMRIWKTIVGIDLL